MPRLKDLQVNLDRLSILVYGKPGTRKTPGAASFPNPYFFSFERGLASVRGLEGYYDEYIDEDPKKPEGWRKMLEQVDKFIKKPEYKDPETGEIFPVKTIIFDGAWSMANSLLYNEIMKLNGRPGGIPEIQDHMMVARRFEEFIQTKMLSLPVTVIMITQEELMKNEETGRIHGVPLLPGQKLPFKAPAYFDEIYHATVEAKKDELVYQIQTKPDRLWTARSRLEIENPSEFWYDTIIEQAKRMPHVTAKKGVN